jgi:hypothetical protein
MRTGLTTFALILCSVSLGTSAMAQISEATRRAAASFAVSAKPTAAPATAVVAVPAAPGGFNVVDGPYKGPETEPALPLGPKAAPAPVVALPLAPPPPPAPKWEVQIADVNLLKTFQRWGSEAGYRIKWDAARHVLVDASGVIEGSFEKAVETVLSSPGIRQSDFPLEVCFYPNQVARITRRGDQQKECR